MKWCHVPHVDMHCVGARTGRYHRFVLIKHLIIIDLIDINKQIHMLKPPCITRNRYGALPPQHTSLSVEPARRKFALATRFFMVDRLVSMPPVDSQQKNPGARALPEKISLHKLLACNRAPLRHCSRTKD